MSFSKIPGCIYAGLMVITIGYCWWAWLALGISSNLFPPEMEKHLPGISTATGVYSALWFWQAMAGISLAANIAWGVVRSRHMSSWEAHSFPLICHMAWIMGSFFWNAIGVLSPHMNYCPPL